MMRNLIQRLRKSIVIKSLYLLSPGDRSRLIIVVALQFLSTLLDLIGVALVGVLGAVVVAGLGSGTLGDRVLFVVNLLHIQNLSLQMQSAVLGLIVALALVARTIATVLIARRSLFFLSRKSASLSTTLLRRLLSESYLKIKSSTSQSTIFSLTYGVQVVIVGILGIAINTIADILLLIILGLGLFYVDPIMASLTLGLFGGVGILIYKFSSNKAAKLGAENSRLMIKSDEKTFEVLNSYREIVVRNRRHYYAREIGKIRMDLAETIAELQFFPQMSKYIIELTMVGGGLLICGVQFKLQDASHAIATLGVFLVASTRIAPAVMRIQQGATGIKSNLGIANPTLNLISSLENVVVGEAKGDTLDLTHKNFQPRVEISNAFFKYPGSNRNSLQDVFLNIPTGGKVAIVGPSGAGKTTLVDALLGILSLDSGNILISGLAPLEAIEKWPGAIGYVPQDVVLNHGSIRDNIALGYPKEQISDALVWKSLEQAQIADFVRSLPEGLNSQVGEKGSKLSGGQRQRMGIARALVTNPQLLVLDEATSSLDVQTELDLTNTFSGLDKTITTVVIAHRLTTIQNADLIIFLKNGRVEGSGNFETLRQQVPDFDAQAALTGL